MSDALAVCQDYQFNYGNTSFYGVESEFLTREEALLQAEACAVAATEASGTVYRTVESKPSPWATGLQGLGLFKVEEFPECVPNAVFDSWSSAANERDARDCADMLPYTSYLRSLINFSAEIIPGVFVDYWKVASPHYGDE